MAKLIAQKALIPNPALKPFEILIGEWKTTGSHPYFPDITLHGRAVFEWHENGAFVIVRSEIDHPKFPDSIQIFGSDDAAKSYFMLHFDQRGTSRKFDVQIDDHCFTWLRQDATFSQRYVLTVQDSGQRLESSGKMSQNGQAWEDDLSLTYIRS
jgi:hypothetical protein